MLIEFSHTAGRAFTDALSRDEQKAMGQFMTPPQIARLMARRAVAGVEGDWIRVLDPASGGGILAAAVVEELLARETPPADIEVVLCEMDERLRPTLRKLADKMRSAARARGVRLSCSVRIEDFLMSEMVRNQRPEFHVVISNPPYFKLNKADERAVAHQYAVYGQPNIYGLFQAATAGMLAQGGRWCFITPRSWMNGAYFAAVRRHLFLHIQLDALHVFESRRDHFTEDAILQEAVIAWGTAQAQAPGNVLLSTSAGLADLDAAQLREVPLQRIVCENGLVTIIGADDDPLEVWKTTLADYGLQVSTGPVIAFRATKHIREAKGRNTVPLLWMQHIKHGQVQWPVSKKREHITAVAENAWMLVQNTPMVLMRRFSPKEDVRRITCAPYLQSLPGAVLGLENHLNYIYRPGGEMNRDEVVGLSAYLGSSVVDKHFRAVSGNTQVNAGELRKLPLPPHEVLVAIGKGLPDRPTLEQADAAVAAAIAGGDADAAAVSAG